MQAAPGEYEAVSFAVRTNQNVSNLLVTASNLANGSNTIPAANVDIKAVKVWWQSGVDLHNPIDQSPVLDPELLLNDDSLVTVDESNATTHYNYVKGYNCSGCTVDVTYPTWVTYNNDQTAFNNAEANLNAHVYPQDAATLQPLSISANKTKQFWVTVHVPDAAVSGNYTGTLTVSLTNASSVAENQTLSFQVTVLPFQLAAPMLDYSVYDMTVLGSPTQMDQDFLKNSTQVSNELLDMRAHGIDTPTVDQPLASLSQYLQLMEGKGFSKDRLYILGLCLYNGYVTNSNYISNPTAFKNDVASAISIAKSFGYKDVYAGAIWIFY